MVEKLDVKKTVGSILVELAKEDPKIVCVDADLQRTTGTDEFQKLFPDRYYQVGIAEQNLLAFSAGIAAMGKTVFPATFASFASQRACDQALNAIAYNEFNVKIYATYSGLTCEKNGGTHISVEDIAIFRCMPNMRVFAPGDCIEIQEIFSYAAKNDGPMYIRLPKGPLETFTPKNYRFEVGKSLKLREGSDIAIFTHGITTWQVKVACDALAGKGIQCKHVHMGSIKPIDRDAIIDAALSTKLILVVEDHSVYGGMGSSITEILSETFPTKVFRVGLNDVYGDTASLHYQMKKHGLDSESIVQKVIQIMSNSKK